VQSNLGLVSVSFLFYSRSILLTRIWFVMLGLISSVPTEVLAEKNVSEKDLISVNWDVKPSVNPLKCVTFVLCSFSAT